MALRYNNRTGMFEDVDIDPQINRFAYEGPPVRYCDESVRFTWEVQDAENVYINDTKMPEGATSYDYRLSGSGMQTFVLKIEADGVEEVKSLQIKVLTLPDFEIELDKSKLRRGRNEECAIKWRVRNAASVRLRGEEGELPLSSYRTFKPESSTDYVFEAVGQDGIRKFVRSVHVGVFDEAIVRFEIDKVLTLPRVPLKLSWDVMHASQVELDGYGVVECRGEKVVECDRETVFTLRVTDPFGTVEYKKRVGLYPLPLIRSIFVPTPMIEKTVKVETKFTFKHVWVNLNINMPGLPGMKKMTRDVKVPKLCFPDFLTMGEDLWNKRLKKYFLFLKKVPDFMKLDTFRRKFSPDASWWKKVKELKDNLLSRIKDKISTLWNR